MIPAHEVAERVLDAARGDCVAVVEEVSRCDVRFANTTTTTNGHRRDRRVTVVRFLAEGSGVAAGVASARGNADVEELVAEAEANARAQGRSSDAAPLLDAGADAEFCDAPALTGSEPVAGVVAGLAEAFDRARAEERVLAGFVAHESATCYLASSSGSRLRHVQATGSLEVVGRSRDGRSSSWAGAGSAEPSESTLASLVDRVLSRLRWSTRRVELPSGRYDAVLAPDAVADLVVVLSEALGGRAARDGNSVFARSGGATRLGEQLASLPVRLVGDPAMPGLECAPFLVARSSGADVSVFDNGAPLGRTSWIDAGRLARLRCHRAAAAETGLDFAPPVDNLALEVDGASSSLDDLVRSTDRGLLLTCLWYIREVDLATLLLTGLTRDGVYLVEHGEVVAEVNNFRFNESPVDLLRRIEQAGCTERALSREWGEWTNRTAMPALRVGGFNMSSVSTSS